MNINTLLFYFQPGCHKEVLGVPPNTEFIAFTNVLLKRVLQIVSFRRRQNVFGVQGAMNQKRLKNTVL
jgi:hypothetical protein